MKIKAANILKVVDIDHLSISEKTLSFFQNEAQATYMDTKLKEHIYNAEDVFDEYQEDENSDSEVLSELEVLLGLVNKHQAGYIRIVYN